MLCKYRRSENTAYQETNKTQGPHQVNCGGICVQVVSQVWLHGSCYSLDHTVAQLRTPGQQKIIECPFLLGAVV